MALIVPGPASPVLSERLAQLMSLPRAKVNYRVFPDGESYIRIEGEVKGDVVVAVQSCSPPQDKRFFELLQLIDASTRAGASRVIVVCPYMAYSRQDKVFLDFEALSSRIVAKAIEAAGASSFVTVNIHSDLVLSYFNIKALNVDAFRVVARQLLDKDLVRPLIVSPDRKRYPEAQVVAEVLRGEASFFDKKRDLLTGEITTEEKMLDVEGRDVVIVDDIISTGGTIANAARILSKQKPKRIIAVCIHGLFVGDALKKMAEAGVSEVVSTDTIESEWSKISVAEAIAEVLQGMLEG